MALMNKRNTKATKKYFIANSGAWYKNRFNELILNQDSDKRSTV